MQPSDFTKHKSGHLIKHQRGYWAFVPNPLPPNLELNWDLAGEISAADRGLSELAGITRTLPNPHLLIRPFMSREAVLSSRIEGTQASLSDLFYFEAVRTAPTKPDSDVGEVRNYVRALEHGLKRLSALPVSLRLMKEIHAELMRGVRGEHLTPGEFRRTQNWIGPAGCTFSCFAERTSCLSRCFISVRTLSGIVKSIINYYFLRARMVVGLNGYRSFFEAWQSSRGTP
jgi:hypothetical protein